VRDVGKRPLPLAAAALALAAVALGGCGGSGGSKAAKASTDELAGGLISPVRQAPPFALRDYRGGEVRSSQFRGKVLLVTFLYTHCPDICPAIAGNLKVVTNELKGERKNVHIVAISADPVGDTPRTVSKFLHDHGMTGRMDYLIGNRSQLRRVWKNWFVGAKRQGKRFIAHSSLVYGVSGRGRLITIYPANFKPADVVHDVPKLERL
jgi:protein SCO1/2